MRINYNFPYFQERLSPRQKARMAAASELQPLEIKMGEQTLTILRVQTPVMQRQKSDETIKQNFHGKD